MGENASAPHREARKEAGSMKRMWSVEELHER